MPVWSGIQSNPRWSPSDFCVTGGGVLPRQLNSKIAQQFREGHKPYIQSWKEDRSQHFCVKITIKSEDKFFNAMVETLDTETDSVPTLKDIKWLEDDGAFDGDDEYVHDEDDKSIIRRKKSRRYGDLMKVKDGEYYVEFCAKFNACNQCGGTEGTDVEVKAEVELRVMYRKEKEINKKDKKVNINDLANKDCEFESEELVYDCNKKEAK